MPDPVLSIVNGRVPDETLVPASRVKVGDPLMFVWNISHPSEIFGIQVVDCMAQTLDGRKMKIIENGCTTDDIIISSVQYGERNQKAFADAMAFKFPDAEDIWIKCSVKTCIQKREHIIIEHGVSEEHICQKDPNCKNRVKRSSDELAKNTIMEESDHIKILHNKLQVIDVYAPEANMTSEFGYAAPLTASPELGNQPRKLCMLKSIYSSSAAFLVTLYLTTVLCGGVFVYSMRKQKRSNVVFNLE